MSTLVLIIACCLVVIVGFQNVRIENLERACTRLEQNDKVLKSDIIEVEEKNVRYLDSCLDLIVLMQVGDINEKN